MTWTGSAGLALFAARNVAFTAEVYYSHFHFSRTSGQSPLTNKEFGLQFGVRVFAF